MKINRYQKRAIVFILLSTSFLAGGFALKEFNVYAPLIGWGMALVCQMISLVSSIKWKHDAKGGNRS